MTLGTHLASQHPAMKPRKLLDRLRAGHLQNVQFIEMISLAEAFGFELKRVSGSHHIMAHPTLPRLLNLQEHRGKAKPYQIRQFLRLIEAYNLVMEDEP
jgi:predicted RNA binding protein YcfA (HicA-like mRNA interferase family)